MRTLTSGEFAEFIVSKPFVVVHFDATWDGYALGVRSHMSDAEREHGQVAAFGEIDIDGAPDVAMSVGILNVPTVAYYRDGRLVAALCGASQSVRERVARVLRGDPIGHEDGTPHEMRHDPLAWFRGQI
jgi:thioredoxin 1